MATKIFEEEQNSQVGDAKRQVEKKARQLVYDSRYDVKKELGGKQVAPNVMQKMVLQRIQKSTSIPQVKLRARQMILGEDFTSQFKQTASNSVSDALYKVFIEGVEKEEKISLDYYNDLVESDDHKYKVRVTDKTTGNSYVRYATREKISQLRANPNIQSVEMTEYGEPREGERTKGKETAAATAGKDYDGDGKVEPSSKEHAGVVHNAIQRKKGGVPDGKDTRKEGYDFYEQKKATRTQNTDEVLTNDEKGAVNNGVVKLFPEIKESSYQKFLRVINEKAVSQNQQQLAGMALAYLRGDMPDASDEVKKMAKMGEKKLRDFAKTKHEGIPEKVQKEETECKSGGKEKEKDPRELETERNLIKNKLRAMGMKNPIVMSAGYEPEGEEVSEVAGALVKGALALGGLWAAGKGMESLKGKSDAALKKARETSPIGGAKRIPQMNSYEPEGEVLDELNRAARERGEKSGGDPAIAARNKPPFKYGGSRQKPKERGEKPDSPHQEARNKGILSPLEHKVALRRAARKRASEFEMDTKGT
jgi:hypothetical protein